jgi:hypothetical protein
MYGSEYIQPVIQSLLGALQCNIKRNLKNNFMCSTGLEWR